jgi:hypothetical protein
MDIQGMLSGLTKAIAAMKLPRKVQLAIAFVLLAAGVAGLLWAFLPPPQEEIVLQLQEIRVPLPDSDQFALLNQAYDIVISLPTVLRQGGKAAISFSLIKSDTPINVSTQDDGMYNHFLVTVELKPELANADLTPAGVMKTSLLEGQEVSMQWSVQTESREDTSGIFWVHFNFITDDESTPDYRTAVLARSVEIPTQTLMGLSTRWVAAASSVFLVMALFLGLPNLAVSKEE